MPIQPTVTLTEEQIAFYHENGFLAIDSITTPDEIERLRGVYDRLFEQKAGRAEGNQFDLAGADEEGKPAALPPGRTTFLLSRAYILGFGTPATRAAGGRAKYPEATGEARHFQCRVFLASLRRPCYNTAGPSRKETIPPCCNTNHTNSRPPRPPLKSASRRKS